MIFAGLGAGGKGVETPNSMNKPLIHKEIKRAVGDRRLLAEPFGGQAFQHLICAHGLMRFEQNFQGAPTHRCEARARTRTDGFCVAQRLPRTGGVVVVNECAGRIIGQGLHLKCNSITDYVT